MLAKTGCTMWSGCQGVKSGRFAQDDRRHCSASGKDGMTAIPSQVHNAPSRTLRALGALATICTRTTYRPRRPHSPIRC